MNAITPNGDGINDKWIVFSASCANSAKVQVFNRYGSKVYASQNYQNDWQGTYKEKAIPDGTYYFVVDLKQNNGRIKTIHGNVTILR
jgi:gliding motility-associated-like protein